MHKKFHRPLNSQAISLFREYILARAPVGLTTTGRSLLSKISSANPCKSGVSLPNIHQLQVCEIAPSLQGVLTAVASHRRQILVGWLFMFLWAKFQNLSNCKISILSLSRPNYQCPCTHVRHIIMTHRNNATTNC